MVQCSYCMGLWDITWFALGFCPGQGAQKMVCTSLRKIYNGFQEGIYVSSLDLFGEAAVGGSGS